VGQALSPANGELQFAVFLYLCLIALIPPKRQQLSQMQFLVTPLIFILWGIALFGEIRLDNRKRKQERARRISEMLTPPQPEP
jgi:hypothetical protein